MFKAKHLKYILIFITAFIPTILNREHLIEKIVTFNGRFYLDFLVALLTAIILWELNGQLNVYLNNKESLENRFIKRLTVQIVSSLAISILITYIIYYFYSKYLIIIPLSDMISPNGDLLVIILDIILINIFYISYNFLMKWEKSKMKFEDYLKQKESAVNKNFLIVHSGSDTLSIHFEEIAEIHLESKNVFLTLFNNKQFMLNENLNFYANILPGDTFFRINRQLINHRKNILSYKNSENGKLEINVKIGIPNPIVSQKSASRFKNWYKGTC